MGETAQRLRSRDVLETPGYSGADTLGRSDKKRLEATSPSWKREDDCGFPSCADRDILMQDCPLSAGAVDSAQHIAGGNEDSMVKRSSV